MYCTIVNIHFFKTKIRYSNFLAGHSEELFTDPLKFKPERWLNKDKNEIHPYASIPFGMGRRMCTGKFLWLHGTKPQSYL